MRRPDAATLLVTTAALELAVGDAFLMRHGRRLVTDVLRRPIPFLCLLVLCAHAADVLGRFDPFRAVARLIPLRSHT